MSPHSTVDSNGVSDEVPRKLQATSETGDGFTQTDFLIVGCGPAGASLACFLSSYGLKGIMISAAPGTANTPRAHITNMAARECLRDIGLDRDIEQVACRGDNMIHTRWCHSMAGQEFARLYSWGNDPRRKGDYELASPCDPADLPQTLLEPILIRYATTNGFQVRFNTALSSFAKDNATGVITADIKDGLFGTEYKIRTKYLFGADGAQSQVLKLLGVPLIRQPGGGLAINVLVRTDLSHLVDSRRGNLHWVMQPDKVHPDFGWSAIIRMVKPWNEWMFILFPHRDVEPKEDISNDEYLKRIQELIGDDTPAEIINVSKWYINEIIAEYYSEGSQIHCLGDAVHRHPPFNGLGSNTCIQDAFNLAWKVAYVHRGLAPPALLDTYSAERQPVGRQIITRANDAFRDHVHVWDALGALPTDVEERRRALAELESPTPEGAARRARLHQAIEQTSHEFHGLGVEMGQRYTGAGVYDADEVNPWAPRGKAAEDSALHYVPSTDPGCRLPHVWLNTSIPTQPKSTIDLAGQGKFTLFTGIGGTGWKEAARDVEKKLGVPMKVYTIGFRQEWEDFYFEWQRVRGVEDSGAVLVRPDRFVAWRCERALGSADACSEKLLTVMRSVLGWTKQQAVASKI